MPTAAARPTSRPMPPPGPRPSSGSRTAKPPRSTAQVRKVRIRFEPATPKTQPSSQVSSRQQQRIAQTQLRQSRAPQIQDRTDAEQLEAELNENVPDPSHSTPEEFEEAADQEIANTAAGRTQKTRSLVQRVEQSKIIQKKKEEIRKRLRAATKEKVDKIVEKLTAKLKSTFTDIAVSAIQFCGPVVLDILTYLCLILAGVCGAVDWIFDLAIAGFNLALRAFSMFERLKSGSSQMVQRFITQQALPIVAGGILDTIPYVDLIPWGETGVVVAALFLFKDLLKSRKQLREYQKQASDLG